MYLLLYCNGYFPNCQQNPVDFLPAIAYTIKQCEKERCDSGDN